MEQQQTFSDFEYAKRRRRTRRGRFLDTMNGLIPWKSWVGMIRPYYYSGRKGRRPKDPETMLRMYLLQEWYQLSAEGMEEAVYDSYAMRSFLGINFLDEQVPAASTLLRFRHLLEKHRLDQAILADLSKRLEQAGLTLRCGSILDAQVIRAVRTPAGHENRDGNAGSQ